MTTEYNGSAFPVESFTDNGPVANNISTQGMADLVGDIDMSMADDSTSVEENKDLIVYLSGGNHSAWRDYAKRYLRHEHVILIDPYDGDQSEGYAYGNLNTILDCDIIFGYKEVSNLGLGLTAEVCYGAGYGVTAVLVIEPTSGKDKRYLGTLEAASDYVFDNLDEGLDVINEMAAMKRKVSEANDE